MNLNDYAQEVHKANEKWWQCLYCLGEGNIEIYAQRPVGDTTPILVSIPCPKCFEGYWPDGMRNKGEMLALVHSELSEALEGHRKNLMDDKLPHRKMFEVELADALIRIFDMGAGLGLDLEGAYQEKMAYNAKRDDHKLEARLKEGGKIY